MTHTTTTTTDKTRLNGKDWNAVRCPRSSSKARQTRPCPSPHRAAWLPGCMAAWLPGCVAAWLPGCLAAWPPGRLAAQDIADSMRVECGEAPHGLFATHRQRLNENPLEFIGR